MDQVIRITTDGRFVRLAPHNILPSTVASRCPVAIVEYDNGFYRQSSSDRPSAFKALDVSEPYFDPMRNRA